MAATLTRKRFTGFLFDRSQAQKISRRRSAVGIVRVVVKDAVCEFERLRTEGVDRWPDPRAVSRETCVSNGYRTVCGRENGASVTIWDVKVRVRPEQLASCATLRQHIGGDLATS